MIQMFCLFLRNRSIEVFLGIARADEPDNQRDYANTGQAEERPSTGFADIMQRNISAHHGTSTARE